MARSHYEYVKKVFNEKIDDIRRKGQRRTRWMDSVESDLGEMKSKRWRKKAENRGEWTIIIKEVKVLR